MNQSTIETDRLILRPRRPGDLDACYAMNREPGTLDHIDFPREGSWEDAAAHRAFLAESFAFRSPLGLGYWTVVSREAPDLFLGWVLMAPESLVGPEIEIGWRFRTTARRQGYATEAARALVSLGFGDLGLGCLVAEMYRANTASMNVARKLGMRERTDPARTADPYVLWELTREMWASTPR